MRNQKSYPSYCNEIDQLNLKEKIVINFNAKLISRNDNGKGIE